LDFKSFSTDEFEGYIKSSLSRIKNYDDVNIYRNKIGSEVRSESLNQLRVTSDEEASFSYSERILGILEQECSRREQELITINNNSEAHNETELLEHIAFEDLNNSKNIEKREVVIGKGIERRVIEGEIVGGEIVKREKIRENNLEFIEGEIVEENNMKNIEIDNRERLENLLGERDEMLGEMRQT
jgi:hypothetical protein